MPNIKYIFLPILSFLCTSYAADQSPWKPLRNRPTISVYSDSISLTKDKSGAPILSLWATWDTNGKLKHNGKEIGSVKVWYNIYCEKNLYTSQWNLYTKERMLGERINESPITTTLQPIEPESGEHFISKEYCKSEWNPFR